MSDAKHTPTPWFHCGAEIGMATETSGYGVATATDTNFAQAEANAEFIVRAVNAHDAMLEALKIIWGELGRTHLEKRKLTVDGNFALMSWAANAIAKAEGRE